jgi:hypothetical protein
MAAVATEREQRCGPPAWAISTKTVAVDVLLALTVAQALQDLSPLKGVGLHKLKGDRAGQWAMTVNARASAFPSGGATRMMLRS